MLSCNCYSGIHTKPYSNTRIRRMPDMCSSCGELISNHIKDCPNCGKFLSDHPDICESCDKAMSDHCIICDKNNEMYAYCPVE